MAKAPTTFDPQKPDSGLDTLDGVIERITFCAPEDQYAVVRLKVAGKKDLITAVGPLASAREGEEVQLKGRFEMHSRYGQQFKVVWWYAVLPATKAGIERYLASGLVKGIGPELARRLVERFGADTLKIIDEAPERLTEVPGIGDKKVKQVLADWRDHREAREVVVGLQGLGLGMAHAFKIYKQYGAEALAVVTANPYRLALDVQGIGFLTADRLAARLNLDPEAPARLAAGLLHLLDQVAGDGHVYVPEAELMSRTAELLKVSEDRLAPAVAALEREGRVVLQQTPEGRAVYKKPAWVAEVGVAQALGRLATTPAPPAPLHLDDLLTHVQAERGLTLSPEQAEAVAAAFQDKVLILTGGPGTGKTTIVSCILALYRGLGAKVMLMAPTGRAAKRLSEATGAEAATIHRALEFSPQDGGFRRNLAEPLKADVVVVDEMSMVDTYLMYHLLRAIPAPARLIMVGDAHQLPAVGPGNVLKDLIDSQVVPVRRLTQIFRQARESLIVVNAHRINQGSYPVLVPRFDDQDFVFLGYDDPEVLHQKLLNLVGYFLPQRYGFDPMRDIQVITPMHRGRLGTQSLNMELQRRLNGKSPVYTFGERHYRRGDKVMQLRNNYLKEVFNGDIGQVRTFSPESKQLLVDFEGRVVTYEPGEQDELTLAYAVSVHKSQGSEFPAVVLVLTTQHYMLLQRNLLYTAITRGRRLVVLMGSKKAVGMALANDRPVRRHTRLAMRLREALGAAAPGKVLDNRLSQEHNQ
jgi:exodeoxyribonuclease V alpha subunit